MQIIFLGEKLNKEKIDTIKIDNREVIAYEFVKLQKAYKLLNKKLANRIKQIEDNFNDCIFLESGEKIF